MQKWNAHLKIRAEVMSDIRTVTLRKHHNFLLNIFYFIFSFLQVNYLDCYHLLCSLVNTFVYLTKRTFSYLLLLCKYFLWINFSLIKYTYIQTITYPHIHIKLCIYWIFATSIINGYIINNTAALYYRHYFWSNNIGLKYNIASCKLHSPANLPNRYSALCWTPVTRAQTCASYSWEDFPNASVLISVTFLPCIITKWVNYNYIL